MIKTIPLVWMLVTALVVGAERGPSLTYSAVILLSGSDNGILRSCYCPNNPWGGLARRAWLVDELRRTAGTDNVLLLDSGDLLPGDDDLDRIPVLARLYRQMRYDAVVAGEQDWPTLISPATAVPGPTHEILELPWKAVGCFPTAQGVPVLPGVFHKMVGGLKVAVLPLVGGEAFRFSGDRAKEFRFADPVKTVREFVAQERGQSDLLVVLSHQGMEADRALAGRLSGVDIIMGGHSQDLIHPPEVVNGIPIFQPGKNGENLAVLLIHPHGNSIPGWRKNGDVTPAGADPFASTLTVTPRFEIRSRLVPLDGSVGENDEAANCVDAYYGEAEIRFMNRVRADLVRSAEGPRLLALDQEGGAGMVSITITNFGSAPLLIEKVRSKVPWLGVESFPATLAPGAAGIIRFQVATTNISGRYRGEYTIWNNDPHHRIYPGSVSGRVPEDRRPRLDVAKMLLDLGLYSAAPTTQGGGSSADIHRGSDPAAEIAGASRILVEFFTSPGCDECEEVRTRILPDLEREFSGIWDWREYDVNVLSNYVHLARLQETHKVHTNARTSVWVDGVVHFDGAADIRKGLAAELRRRAAHPVVTGISPVPMAKATAGRDDGNTILAERLRRWSAVGIAVAGVLDGLNPCAFATVVFMASLLAMTGRKGRDVLVMGAVFTVASYGTYFGLGFGALQVFHKLGLWRVAGDVLRWSMVLVLGVLALLSWRDAWRFARLGRAGAVTLQVPDAIKQRIHGILRVRMGTGGIVVGALLAGCLVTLLESVCTGQIYVPTLVFLARDPEMGGWAVGLLALYNLFFIIPLIVVIVAVWWGTRSPQLSEWSRRNVVPAKVLMGILFATMAVILVTLKQ